MKSMLTTELTRPDAFVLVSLSAEFSRLLNTSIIASRLLQTAFTGSARADHLVFDRFPSCNAFSIFSSLSFSYLYRLVLLVKKTNSCSKMSYTLPINGVA